MEISKCTASPIDIIEDGMSDSCLCELLPWDSDFFGVRIARLLPPQLSPAAVTQALEWCTGQEIQCLYFLADPAHGETIELAEKNGFHLVDIRTTLARRTAPVETPGAPTIRLYRDGDLESLKALARRNHSDSRFFRDSRFPKERAEALFETWIERSCQGWAQAVFVAEVDGIASGYTTCHIDKDGAGSIGLLGLAPHARGRGMGSFLINEAISYFRRKDVSRISVVTQGSNLGAQRLYQKCGFMTDSVQLWYHRWAS